MKKIKTPVYVRTRPELEYGKTFQYNGKTYTLISDEGFELLLQNEDGLVGILEADFLANAVEIKSIRELQNEYYEQMKRAGAEFKAWSLDGTKKSLKDYTGFSVDYNYFESKITPAIMREYGFTEKQAEMIYGKAYEDGHSSFGDIFIYVERYANFIQEFLKV